MKTLLLGISALLAVSAAPGLSSAQEAPMAGQEYADPAYTDPAYPQQVAPEAQQAPYQYQDQDQAQAPQAQAAEAFGYMGPHPLPYDQGGGFCNEQGPHQHAYPVFDSHLFRLVNGYAYFVGDPADFGYSAGGYLYSGNHPLDAMSGGGYCYMGWPHRHLFAPTSVQYVVENGAYVYNGPWTPDYYAQQAMYVGYFSGYYRNWYLGGRYYSLRPRPVYLGLGWHRPWVQNWMPRGSYGPRYGGPGYYGPRYGGPVYRGPGYGGPVYRAPGYGGPVYRGPGYGGPGYRAPAYGGPAYRPPMAAPGFHGPAYRPAPGYHPAPGGYHQAPSFHPAPHAFSAPHSFSAPMSRPAPSFHAHFGRR